MANAVIVDAIRTPVATARKGSLARTNANELARTILAAAVDRTGLAPDQVDDVIFAESMWGGGAVARHAVVECGLTRAGGMAINRHCAGSLTAAGLAAAQVLSGMADIIVAGGVQSTSTAPVLSWRDPVSGETLSPWAPPTHP